MLDSRWTQELFLAMQNAGSISVTFSFNPIPFSSKLPTCSNYSPQSRMRPVLSCGRSSDARPNQLRISGRRVAILFAAFGGNAFQISAATERSHRILRQIARLSPLLDRRSHILPKRSTQGLLGIH